MSDYSLLGKDAALAVEKGLAGARWYATPIPKEKMRELLERSDSPALRDTLLWFALLLLFGVCGYLLWGTWWAVLPFAIYGVLYASTSDSRWHESEHGTAFKTDWMNNALYEIASFMVLRESTPWRWSHTRHHSDTIIVGRDLEIAVQRPAKLAVLISNFFNVMALRNYVPHILLHCTGKLTPEERTYIPESERGNVALRARIYVLIYLGVIALAVITRSFLPLMYIGLPTLYGAWLMVIYGYTQHAGLAENVLDHRLNTRTVYMNRLNRYLYWNMNYHLEHHMFPLVPYHALPKLHALVRPDSPPPYNGLRQAYKEIIPTVLRQARDASYFVRRPLPEPNQGPANNAAPAIITTSQPVIDGWIEVGASELIKKEDVIRFDHNHQTYAIYRTFDGKLYATDGICTHGNAHLAEGFVKGTLIECAKHNGRYDLRDGSPQRLPVCVGLKTYAVRESGAKILLDLNSAGGYGVTTAPPTYTFRVVSNDNIALFIKELVLEPQAGAGLKLDYQPGDYLQFDVPAYLPRTLDAVEVKPPYAATWQAQRIFDCPAGNPAACRRNYSMATNPSIDKLLNFNVRIALPPPGGAYPAGVGSAYLFGLKAGDQVTAIGPFGSFHIKDSGREMVYLGGGSGMAPLRSHLAYLLETQRTARRISYWFGARSLLDLFYMNYFSGLAAQHASFTFHAALSEAQPEDHWDGPAGFIHEVLKRTYLDTHPNPTQIDYYLCGPPAMIQAANKMLKELGVPPEQIAYDEF